MKHPLLERFHACWLVLTTKKVIISTMKKDGRFKHVINSDTPHAEELAKVLIDEMEEAIFKSNVENLIKSKN